MRAGVPVSRVPWVCAVDTCGSQGAPVCDQSDVRPDDATHMQQMAEGHLLLTQWHFLGKAEQTQKPGWDGLREKKNKCPWVLLW